MPNIKNKWKSFSISLHLCVVDPGRDLDAELLKVYEFIESTEAIEEIQEYLDGREICVFEAFENWPLDRVLESILEVALMAQNTDDKE